MFDFMWHLRGSIPLSSTGSYDTVFDGVERLLERQQKPVTERRVDYIAFDAPFWSSLWASNWLAMVIYDRGQFWVEQGHSGLRLRYDLRSLHGMVFCLVAAFTAFFFGFANEGIAGGLKFAVGAFAWLYRMNIMLALVRVPPTIRKAALSH